MNLKEVHRVLRETFQKPLKDGRKRHLVFWYDEAGEFAEDIDDVQLDGVRVWKLTANNLFATKYELEKNDPASHFLIYAPMAKPSPREDWLYDQFKMGIEFATDKLTVIMRELGVADETLRPVFKRYAPFFNNKTRFAAFRSYDVERYTEESIDVTVLAALCKSPINTFDEVVKTLMRAEKGASNRLRREIEKFGDTQAFWRLAEKAYGYTRNEKSLKDLMLFFVLTYLSGTMQGTRLPASWQPFLSARPMNVVVLMNQFMNQPGDRPIYRDIADRIAESIHVRDHLGEWDIQAILRADAFREFDERVIAYLQSQLINHVGQFDSYLEIISKRRLSYWYDEYYCVYEAIEQAVRLFKLAREHDHFIPEASAYSMFRAYQDDYYRFDTAYRKFYAAYDRWQKDDRLIALRELVENVYSNEYMNELAAKWTNSLKQLPDQKWAISGLAQETHFFKDVVQPYVKKGERVFVIISDALRYEVGKELTDRLNQERKGVAELEPMQSTLPSYTALGMAALLPHRSIAYTFKPDTGASLTVDGLRSSQTADREAILRQAVPNGLAIQSQEMKDMTREAIRETMMGTHRKDVVYIYHNSIDASGDHPSSEADVFAAAEKAINDICALVNKLVNDVSAAHIIVTADHGFLYQRGALMASHKLPKAMNNAPITNRRFIVTESAPQAEGTLTFSMEGIVDNNPPLYVTVPNGAERFMIQGAGANYVHGGAMLQEIVVPVITFKSDRSKSSENAVRQVNVKMTSPARKITNLITYLEFFQTERVEEKRRPLALALYFANEQGERISNENHIIADSASTKPIERIYREKFVFKNKKYDKRAIYYLLLEDEQAGTIYERIPFTIDIALPSDLGF